MYHRTAFTLISAVALTLVLAFSSHAQDAAGWGKRNAVVVKGGLYGPTGDLDDFDTGLYTDVMYNRYITRNLALEGGIGFYYTEASFSGVLPVVGSYTEKDKISVIPIKANIKGVLPLDRAELYAGVGVGLYLAGVQAEVTSTGLGSFSWTSSAAVIGAQCKAGGIYNLNESFFVGIEGEYMVTDKAKFSGDLFGRSFTLESNLDGYTISGVFGYRF